MSSPLGIHQIPLPHDGRASVNAILLTGDPVTLVDTGLRTDDSLAALRRGLSEHGVRVKDLQRIVITHAHLDHFGAASALVAESGATTFADAGGLETMATFDVAWAAQQEYRLQLLEQAGAPSDLLTHAHRWGEHYQTLGDPIVVRQGLHDGDSVALGGATWDVISVPGHASSSIALFDRSSGALICGDVLLGNGASNVTLHRVRDGQLPAGWQLKIVESLQTLAALSPRTAYPGHGPIIDDASAVIASRIQRMEDRLTQVLGLLERQLTAYDVSCALYEPPTATTWVGLSAALGYVDALEMLGKTSVEWRNGVRFYRQSA